VSLELREVVKHYQGIGETIHAIDGVSLTIAPGEFAALYGPSGAGKSTLLLIAAAIIQLDAGEVIFDGLDVSRLSPRKSARYRRETIGVVLQSFHMAAGTSALENASMKLFALGLTMSDAARIARPWLERVGLGDRLAHTSAEMSMGERQRVAIARALANSPRLLLADEPTGNLDSKRSREILQMLAEISHERQIPILLVTHDPQATGYVDRVYTLRDGHLNDGLDLELQAVISQ
jgi:putative ABC transport system ATP-binding protein